jgi:hypothetical protein
MTTFTIDRVALRRGAVAVLLAAVACEPSAERPPAPGVTDSMRAAPADSPVPAAGQDPGSGTATVLRSVAVDPAGHATVDFHDLPSLIPNASSSAGSTLLLEELNATVFGVAGVQSVDYEVEGSCERFWEWLQYSCQTVTRAAVGR